MFGIFHGLLAVSLFRASARSFHGRPACSCFSLLTWEGDRRRHGVPSSPCRTWGLEAGPRPRTWPWRLEGPTPGWTLASVSCADAWSLVRTLLCGLRGSGFPAVSPRSLLSLQCRLPALGTHRSISGQQHLPCGSRALWRRGPWVTRLGPAVVNLDSGSGPTASPSRALLGSGV